MRFDAWTTLAFGAFAAGVAGLLLLGGRQVLTGDETRYFMYARSIVEHGLLVMTLPEWQAVYTANTGGATSDLSVGAGDNLLMHGVYLTTLLGPFALLGLAGVRAATLVAGLAGLACLLGLCRRTGPPPAALLATVVAGLSIPLLPYLHIFYMETFLFALVAGGWLRLQSPARSLGGELLTAALLLAIPFVHLRGAVVAAALYAGLVWRAYAAGRPWRAVCLAGLAAAALAVLIAANLAIYGAVTGPVNTARPPLPSELFDVVSMQFFNVRHGLLAYAPVWLLGYAGLCAGAVKGSRLAREGLVLAVIASITGVGVNPGECWPARFWVLSVPMLAVGLCAWWDIGRAWLLRGLAVVLIGFTLVNTVQFLSAPNALVENRQASITYQRWFDRTGMFNFGLPLPVETDDPADRRGAAWLTAGAALFILSAATAAISRPILAMPAIVLLLAALDLSRVSVVPRAEYTVQSGPDSLQLLNVVAGPAGYVQLGRYWEAWFAAPGWPRFNVATAGDAGRVERTAPANQVIPVSCQGNVRSVGIDSPGGVNLAVEADARLVVYRSNSLLRRWIGALRQDC